MSSDASSTAQGELEAVARLLTGPTGVHDAQVQLSHILTTWSQAEIDAHHGELRSLIACFFPKRQRVLHALFEKRTGKRQSPSTDAKIISPPIQINPRRLRTDLESALAELRDRHIFQWSTRYTTFLNELYPVLVNALAPKHILDVVFDAFRRHSLEIFSKGYQHNTTRLGVPGDVALAKALNGMGRFIDIPISLLTDTARINVEHIESSRRVTATLVAAIIAGFGGSSFLLPGAEVLATSPKRWAHALAFLDPTRLPHVVEALDQGDFRAGIENALTPIILAIWSFLNKEARGHVVAGEYDFNARRLLIILETQDEEAIQAQLDIQVFMDSAHVTRQSMELALRSAPALLAAPLSASITHVTRTSSVVVDVAPKRWDQHIIVHRSIELLKQARDRELNPPTTESPPKYNYANQFPLEKPTIGPGYLVERESVKTLIEDIRARHATGISLWTSIRRSGKTTAARELGRHLAGAPVIYQTMHYTEQYTERNVLMTEVEQAIKRAEFLAPNFFRSAVAKAAEGTAAEGRTIVIIDEYERLFQIIRDEASMSEHVRLRVCSPLLSQITEFANDNLIVFLGMNPLAHYVLMQENQMSAYVRPAHFPLFSHRTADQDSEFSDLIQKAMTRHVHYTSDFVDALYSETKGHPFLTVKALRDMLDWMVTESRPVPRSGLDEAVVQSYVTALDKRRLRQSEHFDFFRMFSRETLAEANRVELGWLSASMKVLQSCVDHAGTLSYPDAATIVHQCSNELDPDEVLELATRANLLVLDGEVVRAAIPLLARIVNSEARRT